MHWRRLRNCKVVTVRHVKINTARNAVPRSIRSLLFKGTYEKHECDLVEHILRPSDRVLEIGAGVGMVGLVATRLCGEGRVLSCEANPELESLIRGNYLLNGWCSNLVMCAVTSDGRDLPLFRDPGILSSSTMDRGLTNDKILVESHAINDLIDRHRPTVLVMDVEGSEVELLAAADLSDVRAVVAEMHPHIVGQERIETLVGDVEAKGFRVAEVRHRNYLFESLHRSTRR